MTSLYPHDLRGRLPIDAPATRYKPGPVAVLSVESIAAKSDGFERHILAVISAEGEAKAALHAYDMGWIGARDLEGRLRDILAICEAVNAPLPATPVPAGTAGYPVGTRHPQDPNEGVSDAP